MATPITPVSRPPIAKVIRDGQRFAKPFALLVAQLAYEGDAGPQLAYRFEWFGAGGA